MGNTKRGTLSIRATVVALAALAVFALPDDAAAEGEVAALTSPPAALVPVGPCRLLDTRSGGAAPVAADAVVTVPVSGQCSVPQGITAAAVTITATQPAAAGFVTAWATGTDRPVASTLNWSQAHETRANTAVLPVGPNGAIDLFVSSATHLVVDVSAYFVPSTTARDGRYVPFGPTRLADTRATGPLPAGGTQRVALPAGVDADARALSVTITATDSPVGGYFTAFPAGAPRSETSILNTDASGQTRASGVIVPVTSEGFDLYSSDGGHVVVDVTGWFTGPSADESSDGLLVTTSPKRVLDTRSDGRGQFWPNGSQGVDTAELTGSVAAVVANVTVTEPEGWGFVSVFPSVTPLPGASSVNVDRGGQTVANLAIVPSGAAGLYLFSSTGAQVVMDVTGWFTGSPVPPSPTPHVLSNVRPEPPPPPPPPPGPDCSMNSPGRAAMVDRLAQRVWLCDGTTVVSGLMPFTAGPVNDAPVGEYHVFFKRNPWWGASGITLSHFTAFTRGDEGGRVAFHRRVLMTDEQVGTPAYRNRSGGCFRMRSADAELVYGFLGYGDRVRVLNNG